VGPAAAARSHPIRRSRAGVVTVGCADAAWAQELAARSEAVLARLAAAAPGAATAGIRFVVSDHAIPAPPAPPRARARARRRDAEAEEAARRVSAGVEDPGVREAVERAASAALGRPATPPAAPEFPAKRGFRGGF
jgi:hypothetical protein